MATKDVVPTLQHRRLNSQLNSNPQQPIEFVTYRVGGGHFLHLFEVGAYEAAARRVGVSLWQTWFVDEPDRRVTVRGTLEDAARELVDLLFEPIKRRYVNCLPIHKPYETVAEHFEHCNGFQCHIKGTNAYVKCSKCGSVHRQRGYEIEKLFLQQHRAQIMWRKGKRKLAGRLLFGSW
jgi:hypothetical protein